MVYMQRFRLQIIGLRLLRPSNVHLFLKALQLELL